MLEFFDKIGAWLSKDNSFCPLFVNDISNGTVIYLLATLGFCVALIVSKKLRNKFF